MITNEFSSTDEYLESFRKIVKQFSEIEEDYIFEWDNDIKSTKLENSYVTEGLNSPKVIDTIRDGENVVSRCINNGL